MTGATINGDGRRIVSPDPYAQGVLSLVFDDPGRAT